MLQRQKQENWDSFFSVTIALKWSRSAGPGPGAPGRAGQVGRADGAGRADRAGRTKRARPSGPLGWPGRARTGLAWSGPAVPGPARSAKAGRPRLSRILGCGSPGSSVPGKGCVGFPGKHRDVHVEAEGESQQERKEEEAMEISSFSPSSSSTPTPPRSSQTMRLLMDFDEGFVSPPAELEGIFSSSSQAAATAAAVPSAAAAAAATPAAAAATPAAVPAARPKADPAAVPAAKRTVAAAEADAGRTVAAANGKCTAMQMSGSKQKLERLSSVMHTLWYTSLDCHNLAQLLLHLRPRNSSK